MTTAEDRPLAGPLYHYTSLDVLVKIVESGVMWASSVFYMNDASEIRHGIDVIMTCAAEQFAKVTDASKREILRHLVGWVSNQRDRHFPFFVACFSEKSDDINQWRSYSPSGNGVCIGFDHIVMHDCFREQGWDFAHCFYQRTNQKQWADAFITRAVLAVEEAEPDVNKRGDESFYSPIFNTTLDVLLEVASRIKHPAFAEEREWRLMSRLLKSEQCDRIAFRTGGSMMIPYLPLRLTPNANTTLKLAAVTIGPTRSSELARRSLESYLASKQVAVGRVAVSAVPYQLL
jgi:hypothetical protein